MTVITARRQDAEREEDGRLALAMAATVRAHRPGGAAGEVGARLAAGRRDRRHAWCRERRSLPPRRPRAPEPEPASRGHRSLIICAHPSGYPPHLQAHDFRPHRPVARRRRALEAVWKVVTGTRLVFFSGVPPLSHQARLRCAAPLGALRAALWLEARSRGRAIDRTRRALRVATRWPAATPDRTTAESRRFQQLSG